MEKYNEYKDSDIEWLGEIPVHWVIRRLKDVIKVSQGLQISRSKRFHKPRENSVPYITIPSIQGKVEEHIYKPSKNVLCNKEEILVVRTGSGVGKILTNIEGAFHNNFFKAKNNKCIDSKFCYFILNSYNTQFLMRSYAGLTAIPDLNHSDFYSIYFSFPKYQEQIQIANYLDTKTTSIDKKIKLLKQKIKHYKAYRKILINETVTKGLKNDNSNWVKYRLKDIGYLYSGLSGKSGNDFNQDDNPNNKGFIPFTNIANNTYLDQNHLGTVVIEENEKQNQVKKNDIFFLMSSEGYEDIGKSAVLKDEIKETYLNSFCKGFRITKNNCEASFINYLLLSDSYRQKLLVEGKGFTRINLKMEKINNFSVIIPSTKKEQQQITDYLDAKTSTIDKIVKNIETQITTLKELRKTLINEVVTGKVKVSA